MEGQAIALGSKLESEKHDLDDQEEIIKVPQGKGGKSKRYLYLLLVITAIVAISAIIAVIALAIALGVRSSQSQAMSQKSGSDTCLTQGCIQLAAQMTAAMDQSIDPCEDFYNFSCGNWGQRNPIPPGSSVIDPLTATQYRIFRYLADLSELSQEMDNDYNITSQTRNALDLYQSCMDTSAIESRGVQPLLDVLGYRGGWPLIGIPDFGIYPWSINSTDFFYVKTHGSIAFFDVKLFFNAVTQSRSRFAIHFVQQQVTPLPYDVAEAEILIKNRLSYLNNSLGGSMYDDAVQNIIDLDQRIQNILLHLPSPPDIENGDPNLSLLNESNIYTFERLQALWPGFDWEGFINYMYNDLSGLEVPQDLEIVVTTPAYFERLGPLLQNTSQEVIRDYATFWFVFKTFQNLFPELSNVNLGDHESCMGYVQDTLPLALARPYVMNIFPEETREKVEMMVDYLRKSFGERINQMDWLSDFSKQSSIEKLNAITAYSAYPAEIYDADYVNGLYSNFYASSKDYFGNRLKKYELDLRLELSLTHGYNKTVWPYFGDPTEANAGYNLIVNIIVISAGIATEPIYSADWPDYQLFGGLGVIVGHEITHGFDNEGQLYDKDGIRQMMWSNKSQDEFNNRKQCFIDQYNQYNVSGYKVNGDRTLPENIADTGGLLTSFRAYRMRAETTPQLKLPTLPYTPEQLFFIAFGQTWCELANDPSYYDQFLGDDEHAPNPARVRTVANSPEFAEAFNCPAGTAMNPTDKCTIW